MARIIHQDLAAGPARRAEKSPPASLPASLPAFRRVLLVLTLLWPGLPGIANAADTADSPDRQFLAGLGDRGLYLLAETYCRDRLAEPDLPAPRRAELVIGLSRCLAERAVCSPPERRGQLWQQARQVLDEFLSRHPQNPRRLLVRFQGALAVLARGELARQEAQLVADNRQLLDEAGTQLRRAVREMRDLATQVDHELREFDRSDRAKPAAGLTADQLVPLAWNIQYQYARALRNQGQCFDENSPDRANSLTQAVGLLDPLTGLERNNPLVWKSRIDQIVCYRLLADERMCREKLDRLAGSDPPPAVALRARAERMRLALVAGRLPEAIAMLSAGRRIDKTTSATLDYTWLETYLKAWQAAARTGDNQDNQKARQWQTKAADMVRLIEQLHGPYWTRRAEMLLGSYFGSAPPGGNLDVLVRAAASSYRSGRLDDALAAYDRARAMADKQGDTDRAFELGYVAAAIEHQRRLHQQALARYRRLATAMPRHAKAQEAHLLAVHHAAQLAKEQNDERRASDCLDRYAALLKEHVQTWPGTAGADEVYRRLGHLQEHRQDWPGAIEAYKRVSASYPDYATVVAAAGRTYLAWLARRKAADQPTGQIAAEGARWFESLVAGPDNRMPERWSPAARQAALMAARLRLDYTPSGYSRAERLLSAALQGATDAPKQWTSAARAMLVFSLAGQGRLAEAKQSLDQLSAAGADGLLGMLQGLDHIASDARPDGRADGRAELAGLQLEAVAMLRPRLDQLNQAEQASLERIHARALADAGRIDEALAMYDRLTRAHPRDGRLQESHARLLVTRQDRKSLETALSEWRRLEKRSKQGSARWFRAKYAIADLQRRLDNPEQAAKIIKLLQVLHPELGGQEMKAKFLKLLDCCRQ